uniref:Uncharacterized protein n=1 Tax=Rhizophora mucronata TaxID=61149 RepID=A0A2P2MQD4_RHIMU
METLEITWWASKKATKMPRSDN